MQQPLLCLTWAPTPPHTQLWPMPGRIQHTDYITCKQFAAYCVACRPFSSDAIGLSSSIQFVHHPSPVVHHGCHVALVI
jgi:hypothetical protein